MTKHKLNLRNVAAIVACLAVTMFASCKKETPDLNGTVTISPTANVYTGDELTAAYSGVEKVTWQWNKGGTAIGGATSDKYTPTEAGSYTVTASVKGYNDKTSAAVEVKTVSAILLEEMQSGGRRYEYEFDNQDRMTKKSEYIVAEGRLLAVYTFKYNAAGDLVEWETEVPNDPTMNSKITFTKSGDKITWYTGSGARHNEIELNTQGLPAKYTWINNRGGNDWDKETRNFTWQNGNLTQMDGIEEWKVDGEEGSEDWTDKYTYDVSLSPFYHCKTPKWYLYVYEGRHLCSVNNVKTETWDGGGVTYTYTYNADGFPLTRTGGGFTETYKYKKR